MNHFSKFIIKLFANRFKLKIVLFSLLAFSIVAVSVMYFALSVGKPFMGVSLAWDNQGWVVQELDPNGLAIQAGIKIGDRPVEIDGQPANNFLEKYQKSDILFITALHNLTVKQANGQLKYTSVEGNSSSFPSLIEQITLFITCLIFWSIGIFVFLKRPRNQAALLFCLCGFVVGSF